MHLSAHGEPYWQDFKLACGQRVGENVKNAIIWPFHLAVPSHSSSRRHHILCVEREDAVALALKHTIRAVGGVVDCVRTGKDAFKRISDDLERYDVLVTEHEGIGDAGILLVTKLKNAGYGGRIIVFSTYISELDRRAYRLLSVADVFQKPEALRALVELIRSLPLLSRTVQKAAKHMTKGS